MSLTDEITRLNRAKADISAVITGAGIELPSNARIDDYAELLSPLKDNMKAFIEGSATTFIIPAGTKKLYATSIQHLADTLETFIVADGADAGILTGNAENGSDTAYKTTWWYDGKKWSETTATYYIAKRALFEFFTKLKTIKIGSGATRIGDYFSYICASLESVTIGNDVTDIGRSAFAHCANLASVTIGSGITKIDNTAFSGSTSLKQLYFHATTPPTLSGGSFTLLADCKIYVPAASVSAYKSATNWAAHATQIQAM